MERNIQLIFVLFVLVFLSGCAKTKNIETGMTSAEKAVSIPSMKGLEENGEKYIVTFPVIINPGINGVEGQKYCVQDENGQNCFNVGVYPLATMINNIFSNEKGFYFVTELNMFGDNMAQAIIIGRKSEISKIIPSSRDGHMFSDSTGNRLNFDSSKFYDDLKYQKDFMNQIGESPRDIEDALRQYFQRRGVDVQHEFVEEIEIGSPRWTEFIGQVTDQLGEGYRLPNGEERQGYVSMDEFVKKFAKNEGATSGQRFAKSIGVTYTGEPISSAFLTATSVFNGIIQAQTGITEGLYSEAPCRRKDLAERFEFMQKEKENLLKNLHYQLSLRSSENRRLMEKIQQLEARP